MKVNNRLIAILTIALFAGNLLTLLPLANATVTGALTIVGPDMVAAGGPIAIDALGMTAGGGTIYYYLSTNDEPIIQSGDIYFASVKTNEATLPLGEVQCVFLTASIPDEEYYVKGVDVRSTGRDCVVSDNTIEVISENLPSVVNNDPTGHVGDEPEIEITAADDYDDVTLSWGDFITDASMPYLLVDGEVTIDSYMVPDAYKNTYKIIALFDGADGSYATSVAFSITPEVTWITPGGISIEADALDQVVTIAGTGFPEGTVAQDSITMTLKNFMTGSSIDVYETRHDEIDVDDGTVVAEGRLDLDVTVDAVEAGIVDVKIPVDSSSETFTAAFYSSTPTDVADFSVITHYKISDASGQNGDDVTFSFINLPSDADVTIRWIGATVTTDVAGGAADLYGAYEEDYELAQLPGGSYTVRAVVTTGITTRERTIATFTVNPDFWVDQDEAVVGDEIDLYGTGFPADSTFDTLTIGGADAIDVVINVLATGEFELIGIEVPEVSGGGKDVTVKVTGEDADGVTITAQSTVVINSMLYDLEAIEFDGDGASIWETVDVGTLIFPGHIMKLYGNGFLAGETLTVTMYDGADKLVGSAVVGDGAKVDADGNVELVAWLPNAKVLYPAGKPECYLKAAGSTASNKDNTAAFDVSESNDDTAFILNGLGNDADPDTDVKVGETLRVVGFGFRTKSLDLSIDGDTDIKTVSTVNGFFDTTFTIPKLQGYWDASYTTDAGHYHVDVDNVGDAWGCFYVFPSLSLTPATGFVDSKFTVTGNGFEDDVDFDINWVGIIGDETLDTVDGGDVKDGYFTIEVAVPAVVPQAYKVQAYGESIIEGTDAAVWKSAVFTVGDKSAVDMNKTLTEILAQLKGVDFTALTTQVANAQTTSQAAQTSANAAKTAADAAGTKADAAKTAADAAKTAADAAGTKADAAKTAADGAKTAADSAAAAANGQTTLIYAAIGASLIAALAAIVALMQISRKIA